MAQVPVFRTARKKRELRYLVAFVVVAVVLGAFLAYLDSWPPAYVVISDSMQHGSGDHLGYLNAGDVVFAQNVPTSSIVPYVVGAETGVRSYGEPGDVILYYPNGQTSTTPIIHRAILFLSWNPSNHTYNATDLNNFPCSDNSSAPSSYVSATPHRCATTGLGGGEALTLNNVAARSSALTIGFGSAALGSHSGFLTLGDNNTNYDQALGENLTAAISSLVEPAWVLGVARGLIPWFGAVEMILYGDTGSVSHASWEDLGFSLLGLLLLALGVFFLRRRLPAQRRLEYVERRDSVPQPGRGDGGVEDDMARGPRSVPRPTPAPVGPGTGSTARTPTAWAPTSGHDAERHTHFVSHRDQPDPRRSAKKDPPLESD